MSGKIGMKKYPIEIRKKVANSRARHLDIHRRTQNQSDIAE